MKFFNRVKLLTPESVELEFTLAGIGNRAYALIIDYIVWGIILIIFLFGSTFLYFRIGDTLESWISNYKDVLLWLRAIQLLIGFCIYVGYFVFFETLWQGQTPGKRFVKIRVIRDDGRPIRLQQATLRALLRPFDDTFFLGAFLIIFGKREKRLGDLVAGTLVVQEERPVASANFPISNAAQSLVKYLQKETDLSSLLPEDFAVIRDYLQRRGGMIPRAKIELSRELANQIKQIIALENIPKGVTPNIFLEAVYLAYQTQSSTNFLDDT
ncbi:MAG: RDD family protein [Prochloraceae cyanobacterium]